MKNSISFQMIGIMFGAMTFGQMSDMFGRRTVCFCFLYIFFEGEGEFCRFKIVIGWVCLSALC